MNFFLHKKTGIFLLIFTVVSQLNIFTVHAQGLLNLKPGYTMSCINLSETTTPDPSPDMYTGYAPNNIYTRYLSGDCKSSTRCTLASCYLPMSNKVPQPDKMVCTTFNPTLDMQYWGRDNTKIPQIAAVKLVNSADNTFPPGSFQGVEARFDLTGGIESAGEEDEGQSQHERRAGTSMHKYDKFYAIGDGKETVAVTAAPTVPAQVNPTPGVGSDFGLKQAILSFTQAFTSEPTVTGTVTGGPKSCTLIYWDPYGFVFDSESLEPLDISMATVSLLDEQGVPITPFNVSQVEIDKLGKYNIFVSKDGRYKLNAVAATHTFTAQMPNVKYSKLFERIFLPGDPAFLETSSKPVRMDIPMKSKTTPYIRPLEIYTKQIDTSTFNDVLYDLLTVRVTHPLSTITVTSGGKEVTTNQKGHFFKSVTDKNGTWQAYLRKDLLTEYGVDIEIRKNPEFYPVSNTPADEPVVIHFNPILTYIKGIATNAAKQPIANAEVQVRFDTSDDIFSKTKANAAGLFTITSDKLPPQPYHLVYIDPSVPTIMIKQTTSEFVQSNKAFLEKEKINLVVGDKKVNSASQSLNPSTSPTEKTAMPKASNPFMSSIITVLIILFFLIGGAVFLYMSNKKSVSEF